MDDAAVQLEVIRPDYWWKRPTYRLLSDVSIAGHTVPAGFVTDGATVPRGIALVAGVFALLCHFLNCSWGVVLFVGVAVAVIYFPPVGRYLSAAIVHDWLLEEMPGNGVVSPVFAQRVARLPVSAGVALRREIDREFLRIMRLLSVNQVRRWIMFVAVRINSLKVGLVK